MAWAKLSSVDGDGTSTTLSTGTITANTFIEFNIYTDEFVGGKMRFNSDSGTNYARRYSANGSTDVTNVSNDKLGFLYDLAPALIHGYVINISAEEKLIIAFTSEQQATGASQAPNRMEVVLKWANTSAQVTDYSLVKTGNHSSDTNLTIFGTD